MFNQQKPAGARAEEVATWYVRLNGFMSIPSFVVHLDSGEPELGPDNKFRYQKTEADIMAVRFPFSHEILDGKTAPDDPLLCGDTNGKATFLLVEATSAQCKINAP